MYVSFICSMHVAFLPPYDLPNNIWWRLQTVKLLIVLFSPISCYLHSLWSCINHYSAAWLICFPIVLLHIMLLGSVLANLSNVLSSPLFHEISAAVISLDSLIVLFATCLIVSLFWQVIGFYHNIPMQLRTKSVNLFCIEMRISELVASFIYVCAVLQWYSF